MELQAALQSIHIYSPDPLAAARFYGSTYDMELELIAQGFRCIGPKRELQLSNGPANQFKYVHFALQSASAWEAFAARVQDLEHRARPDAFANQTWAKRFCVADLGAAFHGKRQPHAAHPGSVRPERVRVFLQTL